jgi:uracil-DNA glycosylase family 4
VSSPTPFSLPLPVLQSNRSCTGCALHTFKPRSVHIPLHRIPSSLPPGPGVPALLIVGQNPGYHEDAAGTPFIGRSGELLQGVYLRTIKATSLATVYLTNTARCFHVHGEGPVNAHYSACTSLHLAPELLHILSTHNNLTILTLGGPATTHTYAHLGVKATLTSSLSHQATKLPYPPPPKPSRKKTATPPPPSPTPPHSITLFSTYHPAYVLRDNNVIHAVQGHLDLLLAHLTDSAPVPSKPSFTAPFPPPS